jgi:hypothetical protein
MTDIDFYCDQDNDKDLNVKEVGKDNKKRIISWN